MTTNQTPDELPPVVRAALANEELMAGVRQALKDEAEGKGVPRSQLKRKNQTPEQEIDDVRRTRLAASAAIIALMKAERDGTDIEEGKRLTAAVAEAITAYGDARYEAGRRDGQRWVLCKPCVDAWTGHEEEIERLTIVCAACGSLREQEGARLMVWERNGEIHEENGNCVRAGCVAAPATPTETKPT